jgi:hypothetical protein
MADANAISPRHLFIDFYRTAVIFLMLEGHVVRALLAPYLRQMWMFQQHEFIHGLSAPAFLFGAGMTFVISTRKRWIEYHHWGQPLAWRTGRFLMIISLGLLLHLPFFSFRKMVLDATTTDYLQLFQCDVLACIGIGLLSLHVILFFFKNEKHFYGLVLGTIVAVCLLTPYAWDIDALRSLPLPVAQLMNSNHGSPFPLFPYVGFLYAGVIVSWEFLAAVRHGRQKLFMLRLAVFGASLVAAGLIFDALPIQLYPHYNFWYTSPNYFLIRVGTLMMAAAGCWYISTRISHPKTWFTVLGRESLFVYVLHLILLYGTSMNPELNLVTFIGADLEVGNVVGVFAVFTFVIFATALLWNFLKRTKSNLYRFVQLVLGSVFLYYFFTRDF